MPVTTGKAPKAETRQARELLPPKPEHGTTVTTAFQQIRELIVHGRLSPGTWIVEGELAERLNISRTPVRAALHWLQRDGYVHEYRSANKSRIVVAPLTKEDARELYSIIGHVEGLAGRNIAARAKAERTAIARRLKTLNLALARMAKESAANGSVFELDHGFHNEIANAGAGPRLILLHQAIEPQAHRYWRLYASSILGDLQQSVVEHEEIIQALMQGDADRLERALQVNWSNGCDRLGKVIDVFGARGSW